MRTGNDGKLIAPALANEGAGPVCTLYAGPTMSIYNGRSDFRNEPTWVG